MKRSRKEELVVELRDKFTKAQVAIFADYKGLDANQAVELRKALRASGGELQVIKNNIARVATKEMGPEVRGLLDGLVGPTMVAFAYDDLAAVAKKVHEFAKDNEALELKESLMGEQKVAVKDVEALASLPSREVLLATVLRTLNAPAQNFVSVLAAVPRSFVTVLQAIADKKGE